MPFHIKLNSNVQIWVWEEKTMWKIQPKVFGFKKLIYIYLSDSSYVYVEENEKSSRIPYSNKTGTILPPFLELKELLLVVSSLRTNFDCIFISIL